MENKETFYLDEDGQSILCHIITTMFSEKRKKYYVIYEAENNADEIYVSSYNPLGSVVTLESITDTKELDMINDVLQQIDRESNN